VLVKVNHCNKPPSAKLFRMMVSLTALKITLTLAVSVAHVTCTYTWLDASAFFFFLARNLSLM